MLATNCHLPIRDQCLINETPRREQGITYGIYSYSLQAVGNSTRDLIIDLLILVLHYFKINNTSDFHTFATVILFCIKYDIK